jgi:hypothetical protein
MDKKLSVLIIDAFRVEFSDRISILRESSIGYYIAREDCCQESNAAVSEGRK